MLITIRPFASAKDALGFDRKEINVKEESTVSDVLATLLMESPELNTLRENLLFALNSTYCQTDTVLHAGDILAIFPPVSGG